MHIVCLAPFPVVFKKAREVYPLTPTEKAGKQWIEKKVIKLFPPPQLHELCGNISLELTDIIQTFVMAVFYYN